MASSKIESPIHAAVGLFDKSKFGNGEMFKIKLAVSFGLGHEAEPSTLAVIMTWPFKASAGLGMYVGVNVPLSTTVPLPLWVQLIEVSFSTVT